MTLLLGFLRSLQASATAEDDTPALMIGICNNFQGVFATYLQAITGTALARFFFFFFFFSDDI